MFYFMIKDKNNYIKSYGEATAVHEEFDVIDADQFGAIQTAIDNKPQDAPDGYQYRLRADNLEWELVELPTEPETEPTEEDKAAAYDIIVSGITEKETPKPLEIAKKIKEIVDKYYKG